MDFLFLPPELLRFSLSRRCLRCAAAGLCASEQYRKHEGADSMAGLSKIEGAIFRHHGIAFGAYDFWCPAALQ
jgi:hypothetical protein